MHGPLNPNNSHDDNDSLNRGLGFNWEYSPENFAPFFGFRFNLVKVVLLKFNQGTLLFLSYFIAVVGVTTQLTTAYYLKWERNAFAFTPQQPAVLLSFVLVT